MFPVNMVISDIKIILIFLGGNYDGDIIELFVWMWIIALRRLSPWAILFTNIPRKMVNRLAKLSAW